MVWTKEIQKKLLECQENWCLIKGSWDEQFAQKGAMSCTGDLIATFSDVGDGIQFVEVEQPQYGRFTPSGYLVRDKKIFYPTSFRFYMDDGPLQKGHCIDQIQSEKISALISQIGQLAFYEDGTPNEEELEDVDELKVDSAVRSALTMLSVGILYHCEDRSFGKFVETIYKQSASWIPSLADSSIHLDSINLIKSVVLDGAERELFDNYLRKELCDLEDQKLLKTLYLLSLTKARAEKMLKGCAVYNEIRELEKNLEGKELQGWIKVQLRDNQVISYFSHGFRFLTSPFGILAPSPTAYQTAPQFYSWDDITHVKFGNKFLYRKKGG